MKNTLVDRVAIERAYNFIANNTVAGVRIISESRIIPQEKDDTFVRRELTGKHKVIFDIIIE